MAENAFQLSALKASLNCSWVGVLLTSSLARVSLSPVWWALAGAHLSSFAHLVSMQQLPTCSLSLRTIKCSQVSMGLDGKFEDERSPKEHPIKKPW